MGTQAAKRKTESERLQAVATKKNSSGLAMGFLQKLGPGLITGASDDDPSGIGTYSQVGAQFGYGLLWTMVLSYPLMTAISRPSWLC
jgi:Mn2+/Fe2+ NRAMP family transporter